MENKRRSQGKLYVEFPDGNAFCYNIVKETFLQTLRHIGSEKLKLVNLRVCHRPMFSETIYPGYKDYMSLIEDGFYVNTQGDTRNKYIQLKSISEQLSLNLKIEIVNSVRGGYQLYYKDRNFDTPSLFRGWRSKKEKKKYIIRIVFPDGKDKYSLDANQLYSNIIDLFHNLIIDDSKISYNNKTIVTSNKLYDNQCEDLGYWVTVPSSVKDKLKVLNTISAVFKLGIKCSIIEEEDFDDFLEETDPKHFNEKFKGEIVYIGARRHYIVKTNDEYIILRASATPLIRNEIINGKYKNEKQIIFFDNNGTQMQGIIVKHIDSYDDSVIWLGQNSLLKKDKQLKFDLGKYRIEEL